MFTKLQPLMYERKRNMFPNDKRIVLNYSFTPNNEEGYYLQVASTIYQSN